uniref:Uncharacterized protein n=1 Tax=Brassica campestris TaxID=3711 RepID=A0A3P5Y2E8_BRACM|nr:unnamed protein product [Brassica rapa]
MTIVIGDGNETSANDVSMIQMVDKIQNLAKETGNKKNPKNTVKQGTKYHLKLYVANFLMYLSDNLNLTPTDTLTDTSYPT